MEYCYIIIIIITMNDNKINSIRKIIITILTIVNQDNDNNHNDNTNNNNSNNSIQILQALDEDVPRVSKLETPQKPLQPSHQLQKCKGDMKGAHLRGSLEPHAAPHRLKQALWLFMDFLLHEVVVAALHNAVYFHLQGQQRTGDLSLAAFIPQVVDPICPARQVHDIIILKNNHPAKRQMPVQRDCGLLWCAAEYVDCCAGSIQGQAAALPVNLTETSTLPTITYRTR
jgi:hypothetical protein